MLPSLGLASTLPLSGILVGMPTYVYRCNKCGDELEAVQKMSDAPLKRCPSCRGALRRVIQPVGIVLKGSGFYKTDYAASKKTKAEKTKETADSKPSESKSGDAKSGDAKPTKSGEAKPAKSGEAKPAKSES